MLRKLRAKKPQSSQLAAFIDKGMHVRTLDGVIELGYRGRVVSVTPDADLVEAAQNLLDKMGE